MGRSLHVLIVEDVETDAILLARALERGGFDVSFSRATSRSEFLAYLEQGGWDVVLADYHVPGLGALGALAIVQEQRLDLPFIVTSSSITEDMAVIVLRAGAHDFLLKDQLARLVPAVERELREATLREERRTLQEQLLLSDRLASMGLLAASMVHELSNPLTAAISNLDMVLEEVTATTTEAPWKELSSSLIDTREALEQVRQIVADVKMFSRRGEPPEPGELDIHSVIDSSVRIVRNSILARVKLEKHYGPVRPIRGTASRLGQVFLNLLINAADALPKRAGHEETISITTQMSDDKDQVVVEIHDTGHGIPGQYLSRIFEPFFTTKAPGEGTGLGLAISQRIVQELDGSISASSEPGEGTTFRVCLPVAKKTASQRPWNGASPSQPSFASISSPHFRRGTVLVVDDEEFVRSALGRAVSRDHRVVLASSGTEALNSVAQGESFDLILCDLWMPEMSGMELHAHLHGMNPGQADRMVFLTGGAFTAEVARFLASGRPYLEKPISVEQLRQFVNARLLGA